MLLRPFFDDLATSRAITHQQTIPEHVSWVRYFARWGCLRCGDREGEHKACGCCEACYPLISKRKKQIIREEIWMRDEGHNPSQMPQAVYPSEKRTNLPKGRQRKPRPRKPPKLSRAINGNRICWRVSLRPNGNDKTRTKWFGNVKKVTRAQAQRKANAWLRKLARRILPANVSAPNPAFPANMGALNVVSAGMRQSVAVNAPAATPRAKTPIETGIAPPAPASPRKQIARAKKPRVKPTVRLVNQDGGRYWRIVFRSNGRPKTKWFASEGALSEEQAQALADAWLKEHHPEFFEANE